MIEREPVTKPLITGHRPVEGPEYWAGKCLVCDGWVEDHARGSLVDLFWNSVVVFSVIAVVFILGCATAFLLR